MMFPQLPAYKGDLIPQFFCFELLYPLWSDLNLGRGTNCECLSMLTRSWTNAIASCECDMDILGSRSIRAFTTHCYQFTWFFLPLSAIHVAVRQILLALLSQFWRFLFCGAGMEWEGVHVVVTHWLPTWSLQPESSNLEFSKLVLVFFPAPLLFTCNSSQCCYIVCKCNTIKCTFKYDCVGNKHSMVGSVWKQWRRSATDMWLNLVDLWWSSVIRALSVCKWSLYVNCVSLSGVLLTCTLWWALLFDMLNRSDTAASSMGQQPPNKSQSDEILQQEEGDMQMEQQTDSANSQLNVTLDFSVGCIHVSFSVDDQPLAALIAVGVEGEVEMDTPRGNTRMVLDVDDLNVSDCVVCYFPL